MPKAATKVAIMRSVPSAGSLIVGKVFDPPSARLSAQLGAKRGDLAREFAALPSQRRLSLGLARQLCLRQTFGVGLGDPPWVPGVCCVVAGDNKRRQLKRLQLGHRLEGPRARHRVQGVDQRLRMPVAQYPLASKAQNRIAPSRVGLLVSVDVVDEAVDPVARQRSREPVPVGKRLGRYLTGIGRSDDNDPAEALWVP